MGQLFQLILDNLFKLWPYRIIDVDCKGLRFVRKGADELAPGGHWFCPGLQRIEEFVVTYQEMDCLIQSIETSDGESVTFSANVGYTISDIVKARTCVHDRDNTLERAVRGHLASAVADSEYATTKKARKGVCTAAARALRFDAAEWGIAIKQIRLTDFVKANQQRRFIDKHLPHEHGDG